MEFLNRRKERDSRRKFTAEARKRLEEEKRQRRLEKLKQKEELKKRGIFSSEYKLVIDVDGKQVDITSPIFQQESEFYPFGDIKFLQRSNEIKELLKTKQDDVYGLTYVESEGRFCDCPRYDPTFEDVKVYKKDYSNRTKVDQYLKDHNDMLCKDQQLFSEYATTSYDLGYKCFDDYVDMRYKYGEMSLISKNVAAPLLQCGVDNCEFQCHEHTVMNDHKKRHNDDSYKYKCLSEHCLHRCLNMAELKRHMLTHCKHLFPCRYGGCSAIYSHPVENSDHYYVHLGKEANQAKFINGRQLCYICRKMVRGYGRHKKQHPELLMKCPYPGCNAKFSSTVFWFAHRDSHMIDVMRKRIEENK